MNDVNTDEPAYAAKPIRNSEELGVFVAIVCTPGTSNEAVRLAGLGIAASVAHTTWVLNVGKPCLDGLTLADKLIRCGDVIDDLVACWESRVRGELTSDEFDARLAPIVERFIRWPDGGD